MASDCGRHEGLIAVTVFQLLVRQTPDARLRRRLGDSNENRALGPTADTEVTKIHGIATRRGPIRGQWRPWHSPHGARRGRPGVSGRNSQFGQPAGVLVEPLLLLAGLGQDQTGLHGVCRINFT